MKNLFFLLLAIILISSCKTKPPIDLSELTTLIIRDFNRIDTDKNLIPFVIDGKLNATYCDEQEEKHLAKIKNTRYTPPPPNPIKNQSITINCNTFKEVLKNKQISQEEYSQIIAFIKEHDGAKQKLHLAFGVDQSVEDYKSTKEQDAYQEFGFPIITDNLLVIFRNSYFGILKHETLGIRASGTLLIYRKRANKWALISRLTQWSS